MPVMRKGLSEQECGTAETAEEFHRDSISLQLTIVARKMRTMFDRQVASLGITRSQWSMIAVAAHHSGATQRLIAEALEMSEASAGRLIDRLCADGLLERRSRQDDRRAHAVYLTKDAQPLLNELTTAGRVLEARLFRGFEPADMAHLQRLLDRMYANLDRS